MADQGAAAPTNEQIVRLLHELKAERADAKRREEQIARDLTRLLER
jgi:hypothetical protein